tara:strand:- start:371 stop:541 length:171 start_codon:yes stop_codon:yes gene_type:complete
MLKLGSFDRLSTDSSEKPFIVKINLSSEIAEKGKQSEAHKSHCQSFGSGNCSFLKL